MENIRYEVWLQNQDKFVTQCTIVLIRKNIGSIKFISGYIGSIKFISGDASPDMNFIDSIFFRIRTIVHCVTNSIITRRSLYIILKHILTTTCTRNTILLPIRVWLTGTTGKICSSSVRPTENHLIVQAVK